MITWNKKFSSYVLTATTRGFVSFLYFVLFVCFEFFGQSSLQLVEVKTDRFYSSKNNKVEFCGSFNYLITYLLLYKY